MNSVIVAVLLCSVTAFAMAIGFVINESSMKSDCDNFGAVVINDVKYECRKVTP